MTYFNDFSASTTKTNFDITFEYLEPSHVHVYGGYDSTTEKYETEITTGFTVNGAQVTFDVAPNQAIRIIRETPLNPAYAEYYAGVAIRAEDLNNNQDQVLFAIEENGGNITIIDGEISDIEDELDDIKDNINELENLLAEVSGIQILPNVAALNSYTPPEGSSGNAIQVSDSTDWSTAQNVSGSPAGFTGGPNYRVNVKVDNVNTPSYDFISYTPIDPDSVYIQDLQSVTDQGSSTTNTITAAAFVGDGSGLTNLPESGVTKITAGTNVTITPESGTGNVTISSVGADGSGIPEAPNDGKQYGRQSLGWTEITAPETSGQWTRDGNTITPLTPATTDVCIGSGTTRTVNAERLEAWKDEASIADIVAYAQGTLDVPEVYDYTGNIKLNANGSASFAGIVESSLRVNTNNTPTDGQGIELFYNSTAAGGAAGSIQAYDRDGSTLTRLKIRSSNWNIDLDGSATFDGQVNGLFFQSTRDTGTGTCFEGILDTADDAPVQTSIIKANGSATFGGNITTPRVIAIGPTANDKVWSVFNKYSWSCNVIY